MEGEILRSGQCGICIISGADVIANKVMKGDLSNEAAARELDVPLVDWILHYENHIRNKVMNSIATDIEPIKENFLNKIKEGQESVSRVITLCKNIYKKLEDEDYQRNVRLILAYVQLEKVAMANLEKLSILEGEISQATTINIQHNTLKFDTLMSIVMEDAPREFKEKLLTKLEAIPIEN